MGIVSVESLNVNLPWGAYSNYNSWAPDGLFDAGGIGKSNLLHYSKTRLLAPQIRPMKAE